MRTNWGKDRSDGQAQFSFWVSDKGSLESHFPERKCFMLQYCPSIPTSESPDFINSHKQAHTQFRDFQVNKSFWKYLFRMHCAYCGALSFWTLRDSSQSVHISFFSHLFLLQPIKHSAFTAFLNSRQALWRNLPVIFQKYMSLFPS